MENIDKSWMNARSIILPEYRQGVRDFIRFARSRVDDPNRIKCPCRRCHNNYFQSTDTALEHLLNWGMDRKYTIWDLHGESRPTNIRDQHMEQQTEPIGINEMLDDLYERADFDNSSDSSDNANDGHFEKLMRDAKEPLYPNCKKFSMLEYLIKLLHGKTMFGWSQKSFDFILNLIKEALPDGEKLPKSYSEAKKYMRELGLGYTPIHACKNDCALFYKEHQHLDCCPECGESRYAEDSERGKKRPHKILRYFPLTPRLQRLYQSSKTAEAMRWHHEMRIHEDNIISHPADTIVWREFDKQYPQFASDPRNIRLGLASDGFNPFGSMSSTYSMWPVMLMPYNVAP